MARGSGIWAVISLWNILSTGMICARCGFSRSLLRRETYRKLELSGHVLNAERVCSLLSEWKLTEKEFNMLEEEFRVDDHRYWEKDDRKRPPGSADAAEMERYR